MADFVHLHLHSEYSLLDGACRIAQIPLRAKECGHEAVALTDHGVMYGAVAFYQACMAAGIKPIIGCEVYVAPAGRFSRLQSDGKPYHLVLLCENNEGYANLIQMVSLAFTEGFYNKPRVDMELLRRYHGGLIALSACLSGAVPRALTAGDMAGARRTALELRDIFGADHFYIELQNHGLAEERAILPMLCRLAADTGIGLVATNDCHYLRREDSANQRILWHIATNTTVGEPLPPVFETDELYYKTTEEMQALFGDYQGAMANTVRIAQRCEVSFRFDQIHLSRFPCPAGENALSYLRRMTQEGYNRRMAQGDIALEVSIAGGGVTASHSDAEYRERLTYELRVIEQMGYADYFLIVQDYVNFAKSRDIPVGPGRGSGAGSLVAYCLGITDIDPIRFSLLFERFLNPERMSLPDFDIDFCYNRRDEVIAYVAKRYGRDHVAQIITFGTLAARAVIRDVGRAMGMSYAEVDAVAKAVPQAPGITLADAMKLIDLKALMAESASVRQLLQVAVALEGMPRNVSIHAAGIVITANPVAEYVPLALCGESVITQYDMDTIARLGLLKFDFLALRYLTILHDARLQVQECEPEFTEEKLPLDDAATYALIAAGDTGGVFQLESAGMTNMLMELRPENIDDILAAIALYRPGPMESIPTYIKCRHNPAKITYAHPLLIPILQETFGVPVYQEQVMGIFRTVAGYTFGHADIVRRAMAKKKADVLEAEREGFLSGAAAHGVSETVATKLFEDMTAFAHYAFNKSHAAAYAVISYRTAYMKAHYPRQYLAALLTSVLGNAPKVAAYIAECEKKGILVLPPDVNESEKYFHVSGENIRFGLLALKNVGITFVDAILTERKRGKYRSFEDFIDRLSGTELNKRQVEALIRAGIFDRLGQARSQLMAVYERMIEMVGEKNRHNLTGQLDMFGTGAAASAPAIAYPAIPEFTMKEKLQQEKDVAGFCFSGHMLDDYSRAIADLHTVPVGDLAGAVESGSPYYDRQRVSVCGLITSVTLKTTKKEERMAFLTLEDRFSAIESLAFPDTYRRFLTLIKEDEAVFVEGTLSLRDEEPPKLLLSLLVALPDNAHYALKQKAKESALSNNAPDATKVPASSSGNPGDAAQTAPLPAQYGEDAAKPEAFPSDNGKGQQSSDTDAEGQGAAMGAHANPPPHGQPRPKTLYLRFSDRKGRLWARAEAILSIFPGTVPVICYDSEEKKYLTRSVGFALTDFTYERLIDLLGKENIVYK